MFGIGTIANVAAIITGGFIGLLLKGGLKEHYQQAIIKSLGLCTMFIGLSGGAGVAVAHGLGGRQDEEVHRTVHTAIPLAVIGGVLLTAVGVSCAGKLLQMMGTPENVLPLSTMYMKIYFSGMVFTMVYNFCASILRAAGDTRSPFIFLTIAGVINVLLNVFFVTVLDMNVAGVALATVASQAVSAVLVVRTLMRRTDSCRLETKKLRIYKPQLLRMIRIGLPAGIQNGMFSISNVIIQSSINSFGPAFVNGNSAAANIEGFMWVFSNAFQQASLNFVGQNHGANQSKRAAKALWLCLGSAFTVCLTLGLLASYFGETLLGIYITDSPDAIAYGLIRVARVFPVYFLFGLMDSTTGALRGRGASLAPMLISIIGICGIRLGWIFTIFRIPAYHTPESLYLSFPLSWAVTFCCLLIAFLVITRRAKRKEAPSLASA